MSTKEITPDPTEYPKSPSFEVAEILSKLSSEQQTLVFQKLYESMKRPNSTEPTTPQTTPKQTKRTLNSPETPFKGVQRTKSKLDHFSVSSAYSSSITPMASGFSTSSSGSLSSSTHPFMTTSNPIQSSLSRTFSRRSSFTKFHPDPESTMSTVTSTIQSVPSTNSNVSRLAFDTASTNSSAFRSTTNSNLKPSSHSFDSHFPPLLPTVTKLPHLTSNSYSNFTPGRTLIHAMVSASNFNTHNSNVNPTSARSFHHQPPLSASRRLLPTSPPPPREVYVISSDDDEVTINGLNPSMLSISRSILASHDTNPSSEDELPDPKDFNMFMNYKPKPRKPTTTAKLQETTSIYSTSSKSASSTHKTRLSEKRSSIAAAITHHSSVPTMLSFQQNPIKHENPTEEKPDLEKDIEVLDITRPDVIIEDTTNNFLSFGPVTPKHVEITSIFPPYPKSEAVTGYATVIKLDEQLSKDQKAVKDLSTAMQYSQSNNGGGGPRPREIQFFQAKMMYHCRECAGCKACEFLAPSLRVPHTEVGDDELSWVPLLAAQEAAAFNSTDTRIQVLYDSHAHETCMRAVGGSAFKMCGGQTVIRSKKRTSHTEHGKESLTSGSINLYDRLFIGCHNYQAGEKGHYYQSLTNYDVVAVLQAWGRYRCYVHQDILNALKFKWAEGAAQNAEPTPICHTVMANMQGRKSQPGKLQEQVQCPFYHSTSDSSHPRKGEMQKMPCKVKFHFFLPIYDSTGEPSTPHIAIVCVGNHTHPPPPPRKVPEATKLKIFSLIRSAFPNTSEVTARKLIASPILPIILNGKTYLSDEHITLANKGRLNHFIRKVREEDYPWGTDYQGAVHLFNHQDPNHPYIRRLENYENGHFMIVCQLKSQSQKFFQCHEIHADKTFSRTKCREWELNTYDPIAQRTITLSRVFFDAEDATSYFKAFKAVCEIAETDVGKQLPWGHLPRVLSANQPRIKAILVDEHGGQMRGIGQYFTTIFPSDDADTHVLKIVKVCQNHYKDSINKLQKAGVSEDIIIRLRSITNIHFRSQFEAMIQEVRSLAENEYITRQEKILNWLDHKDNNPWILSCLCPGLTQMKPEDFFSTSFTTNIGESAHANAQREGIHLSLVGAIQTGLRFDNRFFEAERTISSFGVTGSYGATGTVGRIVKNIARNKATAKRREKKSEAKNGNESMEVVAKCQQLVSAGISATLIEEILVFARTESKLSEVLGLIKGCKQLLDAGVATVVIEPMLRSAITGSKTS